MDARPRREGAGKIDRFVPDDDHRSGTTRRCNREIDDGDEPPPLRRRLSVRLWGQ